MTNLPGRPVATVALTITLPLLIVAGAERALAQSQSCEVTISVTSATTANALQIELDHSAAQPGGFSKFDCVVTGAPPALTDVNVDGPTVEVAWVDQANVFTGPSVFASCQFFPTVPPASLNAADFVPTVKDCTKGNPPVPCTPTVSVAIGSCTDVEPVCGNFAPEIGEACDEGGDGDTGCTSHCTPSGDCTDLPLAGCRTGAAGRSKIQLRNDTKNVADNKKDQGRYDLKSGAATDLEEFGDPVAGTPSYHWCVYDDEGLVLGAEVPGGGTCDGKPCWKKAGSTKFRYKSKTGDADGIAQLKLTAGVDGKASIGLKGKSKLGNFVAPHLMPLDGTVVSQLVVENGVDSLCFETTFPTAGKNDDKQYSAKGP
jgi:hypothetical protein